MGDFLRMSAYAFGMTLWVLVIASAVMATFGGVVWAVVAVFS